LLACWGLALALFASPGCGSKLDEQSFERRAEQAYAEANPGFFLARREPSKKPTKSTFARGDQIYVLDVGALFAEYQASGKSGGAFIDTLSERFQSEAKARRKTLEQARDQVLPILKAGLWLRAQDLGAIGPPSQQEQLRPWRKEVAPDLFALLAVPEELLGYRYVSIHEVKGSTVGDDAWLGRAIKNLVKKTGTPKDTEVKGDDGRLLVDEFVESEAAGALILDPAFRRRMLTKFNKEELGAAVPLRDVLIVFDAAEFVAMKPVKARTHQLYDTQNHPGFRGILRFDKDLITVIDNGKEQPQK
jgi:hypothetical protein